MLKHLKTLISKDYITIEDFSSIMNLLYLNGNFKIAVAVSGGSDSLCLALLLKEWSKYSKANITALIVNHNIRNNMEEEIRYVASILIKYGINYEILDVSSPINKHTSIQKNARKARYESLVNYCKTNSIAYLATGHQFNDLIETVYMRQQRNENIWGNAGISYIKNLREVLLFRPVLFFTKAALQNTLKKLNQGWVDDPSNCNNKFERVKVRDYLKSVNNIEVNSIKQINKFRENRIALEEDCLKFFINNIHISRFGVVEVNVCKLLHLKQTLTIVILRLLITFCNNNKYYMPKISKIKTLLSQLKESVKNNNIKATIGGCLFIVQNKQTGVSLLIIRESQNIKCKKQLLDNKYNELKWDNRFVIKKLQEFPKNYFFANLSTKEYNSFCGDKDFKDFVKGFELKKEIIMSLPWLFNSDNKPISSWFAKLVDDSYVQMLPTNSILQDLFCNFNFAKLNINTT